MTKQIMICGCACLPFV